MQRQAKKKQHEYLKIFGLGLLAGVLSFAWTIIWQGGLFSLAGDFNAQQIPFAMMGNDAVKAGDWGWCWSLDLGSGFIGGQSFYTLGNPSFWISLLFPSSWFMYVVGWLYVLKYAVASLTAYMYIRQYVKNFRTASIGALLYAFSGYMATDLLFYHFHDVVALFPLMLFTLDGLMTRRRKGPFIFAVCINALVNYFFIIGEIIFLVAYYIICYLVPDFKAGIRKLPRIIFEGALGCLLGAALLVPSFLFTIQNPRVDFDYYGANSGVFSFERYLYILKGLLLPGEVMSHQCAVIRSNFSSCNAYLPMVGLVLVIAFLSLHKKHWVSRMLRFSLVMAIVPIFNASFSLFAGLYCRWYYMPILIMSLASAIMLERWDIERRSADHQAYLAVRRAEELRVRRLEEELANGPATIAEAARLAEADPSFGSLKQPADEGLLRMPRASVPDPEGRPKRKPTESERAITRGFIIWGLILLGFVAFLVFVPWNKTEPSKIYSWWQFAIWTSVSAVGILLTWLILTKKKKHRLRTLTIAVTFYCVLTTGGAVLSYQIVHGEDARHVYDRLMTSAQIEYTTPQYRFQGRDNLMTLAHSYPTSGNFCSTVSGSIFRFYEGLGLSRDVKSPDAPDGLYHLISARYYTTKKPEEGKEPIQTVYGDYATYYVYEDESVPPMGFSQDTYMTMTEFKQTDASTRAIRMLKTLIINDEDEEKVSGVLRKHNDLLDGKPTKTSLEDIARSHFAESVRNVKQTSWTYAVSLAVAQDKYAFFSIPNDDGWSCQVNGESVEILDSNGFMAVPVSRGENRIVFTYEVPGLKMGILMSLGAAGVTLLYLLIAFILWLVRRKKAPAGAIQGSEEKYSGAESSFADLTAVPETAGADAANAMSSPKASSGADAGNAMAGADSWIAPGAAAAAAGAVSGLAAAAAEGAPKGAAGADAGDAMSASEADFGPDARFSGFGPGEDEIPEEAWMPESDPGPVGETFAGAEIFFARAPEAAGEAGRDTGAPKAEAAPEEEAQSSGEGQGKGSLAGSGSPSKSGEQAALRANDIFMEALRSMDETEPAPAGEKPSAGAENPVKEALAGEKPSAGAENPVKETPKAGESPADAGQNINQKGEVPNDLSE